MQITQTIVERLLDLIGVGFINGAGDVTDGHFCVQQAVNMAVGGKKKYYGDSPNCVGNQIRSIGVHLNDSGGWTSNKARAEGLKRYAVAELGSNKIDEYEYERRLKTRLGLDPNTGEDSYSAYMRHLGRGGQQTMIKYANTAAEVMKEMGTEGSLFLHLFDEPDKTKIKKEASRIGDKIWAAQMAEWGTTCRGACVVEDKH